LQAQEARWPCSRISATWLTFLFRRFLDACTGTARIERVGKANAAKRFARRTRERPDASAPLGSAKSPRDTSRSTSRAARGSSGRAAPASKKSVPAKPRASRVAAVKPRKAPVAKRPKAAPAQTRSKKPPPLEPEVLLERAMRATTPRARGIWARRGLASRGAMDRTIQAMLLRQLYLAHYEARAFEKARLVGAQWLELGVLVDVAHQDIARALQALGDVDGAAGHLRLAARASPASRRAFHSWTLGSLFFLAGRFDEAENAMARAVRWGTKAKPLYQAHLAIVQRAAGKQVAGMDELIERLAEVPAGNGYGRLVLGLLAFHAGRFDDARRHLDAFVDKTARGRTAMAIALDGELQLARATLARIPAG
jgi:tetratricopeptide (TPR) repeat protein